MQAALDYLRAQGEVINEEDEAKLSPLGRKHINFLGHFSFMLPKVVVEGQLRRLFDTRNVIGYNLGVCKVEFS